MCLLFVGLGAVALLVLMRACDNFCFVFALKD